jgi:type I restriction enzyme S subunit
MASSWPIQRLADVCDRVSVGHVGPTSEFFCDASSGVPLLRSQNVRPGRLDLSDVRHVTRAFHEKTKKSHLQPGDILIVRVGHNRGDSCVVPNLGQEINCANIVFARPRAELSRFLGYFFRSPSGQHSLLSVSTGSAQPVLNTKAIAALEVPIPPPRVAARIAHILGTLDDKIELNRRMNQTLEEMARAIFKSWFVDFDPVRAKAEGRQPAGMDATTAALFPDSFEDSELGKIPKGWKGLRFEELVTAKQGKYLSKSEMNPVSFHEFSYPVWGGNGIRGYAREFIYQEPVVILTCRGSNCGLINMTESPSWVSNIAFACIPKMGSADFLRFCFLATSFADCISGSAQPQITYSALRNKEFPFPVSKEAVLAYSNIIELWCTRQRSNTRESRTLALLRDTLLPKLLAGQIRIHDAEKFAEVAS